MLIWTWFPYVFIEQRCIRECFNIKTVALNALPSGGQDGSEKAITLGKFMSQDKDLDQIIHLR